MGEPLPPRRPGLGKEKMPKRQAEILCDPVRPDPVIAHLDPAARRQTHIRPMQICEQRAVPARPPPKEIKQRRLLPSDLRSACGRIRRGGLLNPPRRAAAFV